MKINKKIRELLYEILNTYKYRPDTKYSYSKNKYDYLNYWVWDNSDIDNIFILWSYWDWETEYETAFYIKWLKDLTHNYNFINAISLYLIFNFDEDTINNLLSQIKAKIIPNLSIEKFTKCKWRISLVNNLYTIFRERNKEDIVNILDIFAFDLDS